MSQIATRVGDDDKEAVKEERDNEDEKRYSDDDVSASSIPLLIPRRIGTADGDSSEDSSVYSVGDQKIRPFG